MKGNLLIKHKSNLIRNQLVENFKHLKKINDSTKLIVYECLTILNIKPGINKQNEDFLIF